MMNNLYIGPEEETNDTVEETNDDWDWGEFTENDIDF